MPACCYYISAFLLDILPLLHQDLTPVSRVGLPQQAMKVCVCVRVCVSVSVCVKMCLLLWHDFCGRYALLMVMYCCCQAERAVQDHVSQLQEELQGLKDAKQHHAEQQCEQVGTLLPMSMRVCTVPISSLSILFS